MSFFFAPFADELLSACPDLSFDELLPFSSDLSFSDLSFSSDLSFCSDLSFDELLSTCPDDKAVARTKRTANAAPQTVSISPTLPRTFAEAILLIRSGVQSKIERASGFCTTKSLVRI